MTVEGRPLEESELIERAQRGDLVAYGDLVRAYQDVAVRTAYLACGDAAEAEDAVQEALIKAHRALGRFRAGAPFRPWLLQIVANEARNRRRAAGRRASLWARAAQEDVSGGAAPPPESTVVDAERREELLAALGRLREDDRAVLGCRFLIGLSEHETAAALGLRLGTVKSRTARALGRLRAAVGEEVVA